MHRQLLRKPDDGSQPIDQKLALIIWEIALAGGIHECGKFLPAGSPLSDFARPHDNVRCAAGTGWALIGDLACQCNNAIER